MRLFLISLCLFSTAQAQSFQRLVDAQDVAARFSSARQQLIVVTPVIDTKVVAEAIRRVAVERGVNVFLLLAPEFVEAPSSYGASLGALAGVQIRLANIDRSFALVDADQTAVVLEGALLGSGSAAFLTQESYAITDAKVISARSALFAETWEEAVPYVSLVNRLEGPQLEPETLDLSILGGL